MEFTKTIFVNIEEIVDYIENDIEIYLNEQFDDSDLDAIDYNMIVAAVGRKLVEKRGNKNER